LYSGEDLIDLAMDLTVILGPMKSGKTYELISLFAPLSYTKINFKLYQSVRNVRDEFIESRNGVHLQAQKIKHLSEILDTAPDVIGIDEIHMFPAAEIDALEELLKRGKRVVVSGLDTDYKGKLFDTVARLFELGPKEIKYRRAVCETCKTPDAIYTQILGNGTPVVAGLPPVVPDDGTYSYQASCRNCFVKERP
jgi:thymidine kinase